MVGETEAGSGSVVMVGETEAGIGPADHDQ